MYDNPNDNIYWKIKRAPHNLEFNFRMREAEQEHNVFTIYIMGRPHPVQLVGRVIGNVG